MDFCNDTATQGKFLPEHLLPFVTVWPEQLLKIALILHTASDTADERVIESHVLDKSVSLMRRLGDEQLRIAEAIQPASIRPLEPEIEVMVAKIRLYGPSKKRDIFRRYNNQSYERLEPTLAKCLERKLVRLEGDLLYPAQHIQVNQNDDKACS